MKLIIQTIRLRKTTNGSSISYKKGKDMYLFGKNLRDITEEDLQRLVDEKFGETNSREYKREIKLDTKDAKKELCKDVSAMANSDGGYIIFGIEEETSVASKLNPLENTKLVETMEQVLQDSVVPRLRFKIHTIESKKEEGKVYYIVEVPRSTIGVHMNKYDGAFYKRRNFRVQKMDYSELQDSFREFLKLEQSIEEKIEKLNKTEVIDFYNEETFKENDAMMVMYFLPLFDLKEMFDAGRINEYELDLNSRLQSLYPSSKNETRKIWGELFDIRIDFLRAENDYHGAIYNSNSDDEFYKTVFFESGDIASAIKRSLVKNDFDFIKKKLYSIVFRVLHLYYCYGYVSYLDMLFEIYGMDTFQNRDYFTDHKFPYKKFRYQLRIDLSEYNFKDFNTYVANIYSEILKKIMDKLNKSLKRIY